MWLLNTLKRFHRKRGKMFVLLSIHGHQLMGGVVKVDDGSEYLKDPSNV